MKRRIPSSSSCPLTQPQKSALHDKSKSREDTRKHDSQAVASPEIKGSASSIGLSHGRRPSSAAITETVVDDWGGAGSCWCAAGGGGCGVASRRVLGAAGVVLGAGGLAGVDAAAAGDALLAPFDADVEGDGEAVLGHVGGEAVAAGAVVCEGFLGGC
jgi:hypothetical protein